MAKIIENCDFCLQSCVKSLHSGQLVAFPTETVYGLGASLWKEDALEKIFFAKNRPKTDPLIVHVARLKDSEDLISVNEFQRNCFDILAKKFWPGPLTQIVNASNIVPKIVMGGGNCVGIRIPAHPIAQKLLSMCECPIAAPSANIFGHVSPTSAQHVYDDLKHIEDLLIIDDDTGCKIGIESTVIKIEEKNIIKLLRPGIITRSEIENELKKHNISFILAEKTKNVSRETFLEEAPGQRLTHYSPWVDTYMIQDETLHNHPNYPVKQICDLSETQINLAAVLDFGRKHINLKKLARLYSDLSESANYQEASQNLFRMLREAEKTKDVNLILISNIGSESENAMGLFDRIYRATSGKYAKF